MFAYCNNNSVNFTDPRGDVAVSTDSFWGWVGGKIGIWFAELITGNHYETGDCINPIAVDAVETAVDIGTAFVNNAEISGGFGLGLAGEAVLLDYISLSGGVAYDVFHITLTPNNIRIRERSQIGFDASYSVLELGSSEQQFRDYSNNYPNEFYNDDSTKSVIFGTGRYFFMGGSFQISLNVECFCNEVLQVLLR